MALWRWATLAVAASLRADAGWKLEDDAGWEREDDESWKFLVDYPPQYDAVRTNVAPKIDGVLDDDAWRDVAWTAPFVDIAQTLFPESVIPPQFATRAKFRWDEDFLYIGAELRETNPWASISGHNAGLMGHKAPWWDPDFEVFVDAGRTTHDYKEFEMNGLNATYDVLWRTPSRGFGSPGVPCDQASATLWCQNSTFNAGQAWTMAPLLRTATDAGRDFVPLEQQSAAWVVEIAMPLDGGKSGGLLDGDFDSNAADPRKKPGVFWWVNLARAEHPLRRSGAGALSLDFGTADYGAFCADVKRAHPTLLGTDAYSCYWEWVWADMRASRYMHNPEMWGMLRFDDEQRNETCRDAEFPARHVVAHLHRAMVSAYVDAGAYPHSLAAIVACGAQCCDAKDSCDLRVLERALQPPFDVVIAVDVAATTCVDYAANKATGAACFNATLTLAQPNRKLVATLREDRFTSVRGAETGACL